MKTSSRFSRTNEPILTKLGRKHQYDLEIQISSNKGPFGGILGKKREEK